MNTYFPDGDNHITLNMLVLFEKKKAKKTTGTRHSGNGEAD